MSAETAVTVARVLYAVPVLIVLALAVVAVVGVVEALPVRRRPVPVPPPAAEPVPAAGQMLAIGRAAPVESDTAEYATYGRHAAGEVA